MASPLIILFCLSNLDLCKTFKVILAFFVTFTLSFTYLNSSAFTSCSTAFLWSGVVSTFFTLGLSTSVHFRCATVVFAVQCFFRFGLFMFFVSASWIMTQHGLSTIVMNQQNYRDTLSCVGGVSFNETIKDQDDEINTLRDVVSFLYFGVLIPYGAIFLYSLLYESTFVPRQLKKRSSKPKDKGKGKVKKMFAYIFRTIVSFILGLLFASTLCIWVVQRVVYRSLEVFETDIVCPHHAVAEISSMYMFFYIMACAALGVLSIFSAYIITMRGFVIRKFFKLEDGELSPIKESIYVIKAKKDRVTLDEVRSNVSAKITGDDNCMKGKESCGEANTTGEGNSGEANTTGSPQKSECRDGKVANAASSNVGSITAPVVVKQTILQVESEEDYDVSDLDIYNEDSSDFEVDDATQF